MRTFLLTILFLQLFSLARAQQYSVNPDSLKLLLSKTSDDTEKVLMLSDLGFTYAFFKIDTSIMYAQRAISLARQLNYKKGEAAGMSSYSWVLWSSANYDKAAEMALKSLNLYKGLQDHKMLASLYTQLAVIYRDAGDYQQALSYGTLAKNVFDSSDLSNEPFLTIGSIYLLANEIDSASFYVNKSYELNKEYPFAYLLYTLGEVEAKRKHYQQALHYYRAAIHNRKQFGYSFCL